MKKIIIPALILMLGGIISAFAIPKTYPSAGQHFTNQYWHFTGTTSGEESDASKYVPIDDPDEPACEGNTLRCVIEAPPQSGDPDLPDLSGSVSVISRKN